MKVAIVLHNIRSAHNVGAILRTADGAGVSHVYLSGYTPTPQDRFGRVQKDISKTALGAEKTTPWSYVRDITVLLQEMRKKGWAIVGVEQDTRAKNFRTFHKKKQTLFIFGNEVRGISKPLRDLCDELIEIPMRGHKESLNVSVAAGIILFNT
ncbi:TrmH family RNA methyltransferase [Candidatus Parcubacteria bacterium]|nr:MAG: TrmH family RNA methyltransferase [Candidatus Parcubacteria bacterium]